MRQLTDQRGQSWTAERVGRTSGMIPRGDDVTDPEPHDIVRFRCKAGGTKDREITLKAGLLEELSDEEMRDILESAPPAP